MGYRLIHLTGRLSTANRKPRITAHASAVASTLDSDAVGDTACTL
jgi:hypothetical protein